MNNLNKNTMPHHIKIDGYLDIKTSTNALGDVVELLSQNKYTILNELSKQKEDAFNYHRIVESTDSNISYGIFRTILDRNQLQKAIDDYKQADSTPEDFTIESFMEHLDSKGITITHSEESVVEF